MKLINASQVRKFMLAYARANRSHEFTRVSKDTLLNIEAELRGLLISHVARHPSKGKTL